MRFFLCCCFAFVLTEARPPRKNEVPSKPQTPEVTNSSGWDIGLDYNRYLQEVIQVLESDPDFRKKLEKANASQIRDGSIANELEFVDHHVRSQLDDIKRREIDRLRHSAMRQYELNQGIDRKHIAVPTHLELHSMNFGKKDLEKLIISTAKDLEEADQKRRDDFKKYEMEKKFENEERLKHIEDEAQREKERQRMEEAKKRHKNHEKLNHPMTKDQLEEVWEEQDHMRPEEWNPKTFFALHDLNGDNQWDENELKILFKNELEKAYDPNNGDDDMKERDEEMERMREHVMKESDKDKNRLISFDEFMAETKRQEFENDPGWDTLDDRNEELYSEEEFRQFEIERQRELQLMLDQGLVPPGYPYYGDIPPGAVPYHPGGPSIPGQPAFVPHPGIPQQGVALPRGQGHGVPQQGIPLPRSQGVPQQGMPLPSGQGVPQQGVPLPRSQGEAVPQQRIPQQGIPQQGVPQHGVPQQGVPQQGVPQHGVPQQGVPQHRVPQHGVPQQGVLQQGVPQQGVPQQGVPQHGVPQQGVPQHGVPQHGVPQQGAPPQQGVPQQEGHQQEIPQQRAPPASNNDQVYQQPIPRGQPPIRPQEPSGSRNFNSQQNQQTPAQPPQQQQAQDKPQP